MNSEINKVVTRNPNYTWDWTMGKPTSGPVEVWTHETDCESEVEYGWVLATGYVLTNSGAQIMPSEILKYRPAVEIVATGASSR